MRFKQQLLTHFQRLHQQNVELTQALEKYRQETEYVCLKTGIPDWPAFLTAVRTGKVAAIGQGHQTPAENEGPAMALLNGLFQNASTARAHRFCQCQSPICSEGSVRHPKGGDTSRSESEDLPDSNTPPQQTLQCILKEIEQYQQERAIPLQGFDTFRKPDKEETLNETAAQGQSTEKSVYSMGRHLEQTAKVQHPFKPVWRRGQTQGQAVQVQEWRPSPSSNEFTLALQNTRLRKQLREMQARLC